MSFFQFLFFVLFSASALAGAVRIKKQNENRKTKENSGHKGLSVGTVRTHRDLPTRHEKKKTTLPSAHKASQRKQKKQQWEIKAAQKGKPIAMRVFFVTVTI